MCLFVYLYHKNMVITSRLTLTTSLLRPSYLPESICTSWLTRIWGLSMWNTESSSMRSSKSLLFTSVDPFPLLISFSCLWVFSLFVSHSLSCPLSPCSCHWLWRRSRPCRPRLAPWRRSWAASTPPPPPSPGRSCCCCRVRWSSCRRRTTGKITEP